MFDNIAVYRLRETQPLLVLALHEADKHLQNANSPADKRFYAEYILRLKTAIGANTDAVITAEDAAQVKQAEADFQFECLPESAVLTPLCMSAADWLESVLPALYAVRLGKPCRMTRELAVQLVEKVSGLGMKVRAA